MAHALLMVVLMMKTVLGAAVVVGILGVAGCAAESSDEGAASRASEASRCSVEDVAKTGGAIETKGLQWNGRELNGLSLNGMRMNGLSLNGIRLNGVALNGVELNGWNLNGWSLNGPLIQGTKLNGPLLQGTKLNGVVLQGTRFGGLPAGMTMAGAELVGELSDGSKISITIDEVRENPNAQNADVALYAVSFGDAHEPLCGKNDQGQPILATAIANTWDEKTGARIDAADRFTFACQGAALYKCVDAGYKPWKSAELAEYHQACTRMIRADYCGDGTSYTKDGTLIDMGDAIGVQKTETDARPDFAFEATWGPNGATCVSKTRYRLTSIPSCLADRLHDSCDASVPAEGNVRLMNRSSSENACLR